MDVVYVNRDGENPELRYSLRSLANVQHSRTWIIGGCPVWVNPEAAVVHRRAQSGSGYASTRAHIKAACLLSEISDPFTLWNDDFYAMKPVGEVPAMHRGPLDWMIEQFAGTKTPWARGLFETVSMLAQRDYADPLSYDTHLPLIVHKEAMLEALRWARNAKTDAVHVRTLYGNLAELGGVEMTDPKLMRKNDPFPTNGWLSSGDDTFRSTIEPVLRYVFPNPSIYEKD